MIGRRSTRGNLQHALDGPTGTLQDVLRQFDAWGKVLHAIADFFERVHFHEFALATAAVVAGHPHHVLGRRAEKLLVRTFFLHPVDDAGLGDDDELLRRIILAEGDHLLGRADRVGKVADFAEALGMDDDFSVGELLLGAEHSLLLEFDVGITVAFPEGHGATGLFHDPLPEVFIGHEEEFLVLRRSVDDFLGVAAGDDDIAQRLHCGAAIDVGNGPEIGVGFLQGFQFFCRTALFKGATGVFVREDDDFFRV